MSKRSKLPEKAARVPDLQEAAKQIAIEEYAREVRRIRGESARSHRFTALLNALFGVQPGFIEQYVNGIEKYLKVEGKDRMLRGRADQFSGNLIVEFESDISSQSRLAEAEEQLRRYTACAWSNEPPEQRTPFLCLATDGLRFRAYAPLARQPQAQDVEPQDLDLRLVEKLDAGKVPWREFFYFLDRYLLRQQVLAPTSENIVKDFGPRSRAFQHASEALARQWRHLSQNPHYAVLYDAWRKYLRIVYGSDVADEGLFIRHSYLASLAKLMVWCRFTDSDHHPDNQELLAILRGTYFRQRLSVENFLEEDFFSWLARPEAGETGVRVARMLLDLLRSYNLRELSEDVLKALYEGLVDPATRHDLGEYYTPDWLAHRIVRKVLDQNPRASLLDPACGSGTFLYMAIREKRQRLGNSARTLRHIESAVVGMDVHPLACIVAKANYLLALGDLIGTRRAPVSIPIYLANSIQPPEEDLALLNGVECFRAEIDGETVFLAGRLMSDPPQHDEAMNAAREFAVVWAGKKATNAQLRDEFEKFLRRKHPALAADEEIAWTLLTVAQAFRNLIAQGRDTIWAFVLKNIYKPLALREKFNAIVGNPPWLSFRYVDRSEYRDFLKTLITQTYRLVTGRAHLVTHLELGTLFFVRCAHLYLKKGGTIAFVLPKSIFSADQHDALRRGAHRQPLAFEELWDLEAVQPIFNISACVAFARKGADEKASQEIPGQVLAGTTPTRNCPLDQAEQALSVRRTTFHVRLAGRRSFLSEAQGAAFAASPYRDRFQQGASIVPRSFWFVEVQDSPLGFDAARPPLATSELARKLAKPRYRDCVLRGAVEREFFYVTLLPAHMLPFGYSTFSPVVLPVEANGPRFSLLDADAALHESWFSLLAWLERVEEEWKRRRTPRQRQLSALDWLDYRHKLTSQSPRARFRTLYCTSGTHLCACVVATRDARRASFLGVRPKGFVADYTTYQVELGEDAEAHYLAAVLNAPCVDEAITDLQARGLWGARHICKKVLELPIPQFHPENNDHLRLSQIGRECAAKVRHWVRSGGPGQTKSTGLLRRRVREMLADELRHIDSIVKPMLGI